MPQPHVLIVEDTKASLLFQASIVLFLVAVVWEHFRAKREGRSPIFFILIVMGSLAVCLIAAFRT